MNAQLFQFSEAVGAGEKKGHRKVPYISLYAHSTLKTRPPWGIMVSHFLLVLPFLFRGFAAPYSIGVSIFIAPRRLVQKKSGGLDSCCNATVLHSEF